VGALWSGMLFHYPCCETCDHVMSRDADANGVTLARAYAKRPTKPAAEAPVCCTSPDQATPGAMRLLCLHLITVDVPCRGFRKCIFLGDPRRGSLHPGPYPTLFQFVLGVTAATSFVHHHVLPIGSQERSCLEALWPSLRVLGLDCRP